MKVRYQFKRAETADEVDQIFRLNHAVFAGELEQYPTLASERLVDKFHEKNAYVIALAAGKVIGMVSIHDQPPFSVAGRLADPGILDSYGRLSEIRLLAVEPAHRHGMVMAGLMLGSYEYARAYDAVVISGHLENAALYHRLGFTDLGPPVESGNATYVPMVLRVSDLAERQARWQRRFAAAS
jgi:N-acyl-L-homoserine lactone synthetase